jgi:hypothetical protein
MTKEELKRQLNKCPACKKKPEGFSVISILKDDFLTERLGNRTKKYYQLKCDCGNMTNGYEDKSAVIKAWNEAVLAGQDIKERISA